MYLHTKGFASAGEEHDDQFVFRQGRSRETSYARDYDHLMELLRYEKEHGNILWVKGPAFAIDYDARRAMQRLMENGYAHGLLAGNAVVFIDGFDQAMKISSAVYPSMGVTEVEMEKVLRGSREGFSDSVKINSALIRKRLRDTRLKVVEFYIGERSHTLVQMVYMVDKVISFAPYMLLTLEALSNGTYPLSFTIFCPSAVVRNSNSLYAVELRSISERTAA